MADQKAADKKPATDNAASEKAKPSAKSTTVTASPQMSENQQWTKNIQAGDTLKQVAKKDTQLSSVFEPMAELAEEEDEEDFEDDLAAPVQQNRTNGSSQSQAGAADRAHTGAAPPVSMLRQRSSEQAKAELQQLPDQQYTAKLLKGNTLQQFKKKPGLASVFETKAAVVGQTDSVAEQEDETIDEDEEDEEEDIEDEQDQRTHDHHQPEARGLGAPPVPPFDEEFDDFEEDDEDYDEEPSRDYESGDSKGQAQTNDADDWEAQEEEEIDSYMLEALSSEEKSMMREPGARRMMLSVLFNVVGIMYREKTLTESERGYLKDLAIRHDASVMSAAAQFVATGQVRDLCARLISLVRVSQSDGTAAPQSNSQERSNAENLSEEERYLANSYALFQKIDADNSGSITSEQLVDGIIGWDGGISQEQLSQLYELADSHHSQLIDFRSFVRILLEIDADLF